MDLSYLINSAETEHKQNLEDFFRSIFVTPNLESHGLEHHRRVWNNARELLSYKAVSDKTEDPDFPARLLIASYLHDSGMAIDAGPDHGLHSSLFCNKFLEKYNLAARFSDVTEAVLNHDKKDYGNSSPSLLLSLLSVADDADAFGYTGIYRYLEIYLIRNIPSGLLGITIRENALKRFKNLEASLSSIPGYVEKQRGRFEILDQFFINYNRQADSREMQAETKPRGYTGVAELIKSSLQNNLTTGGLIDVVLESDYDKVIKSYFSELQKEI